jgi:hypothetical protein
VRTLRRTSYNARIFPTQPVRSPRRVGLWVSSECHDLALSTGIYSQRLPDNSIPPPPPVVLPLILPVALQRTNHSAESRTNYGLGGMKFPISISIYLFCLQKEGERQRNRQSHRKSVRIKSTLGKPQTCTTSRWPPQAGTGGVDRRVDESRARTKPPRARQRGIWRELRARWKEKREAARRSGGEAVPQPPCGKVLSLYPSLHKAESSLLVQLRTGKIGLKISYTKLVSRT